MNRKKLVACLFGLTVFGSHSLAIEPPQYKMKVVGIAKGSSANFRAEPKINGKVIAKIPHNARGLIFSGACRGINGEVVPPSSDTINPYWCRVLYRDQLGWIAEQYITEQ